MCALTRIKKLILYIASQYTSILLINHIKRCSYLLTCSVTLRLHNFAPTSSVDGWNSETRTIIENDFTRTYSYTCDSGGSKQ